ncbi:hypothetical protein [Kitasatospora cinereorecta]
MKAASDTNGENLQPPPGPETTALPDHPGPCRHDESCDLLDVVALADDEQRCCARHHPEADRHDPLGYRIPH